MRTIALFLLCVVFASADFELDPPYCAARYRRLCQGKGRHVACAFPRAGPGESCVNYTMLKFTKQLRQYVTNYINRRRQRLAAGLERVRGGVQLPRPEVMMQVEWDRELAMLAQRLADQCSFVHDDCRATVRFPYAGQTVGEVKWRHTSDSDTQNVAQAIRRVLDAWWGERRRVTAKQLVLPFRLNSKGSVWGHFSQLAVWTLRAVGCGAVRHGTTHPRLLLVCDFSHTNMLGQRTIVPGAMSACPIHTARRFRSQYPLLCAPVRYQEFDDPYNNQRADKIIYDDIHLSEEDTHFVNDTEQEDDEDHLPEISTRKQIKLNEKKIGVVTQNYNDIPKTKNDVYVDDPSDVTEYAAAHNEHGFKKNKNRQNRIEYTARVDKYENHQDDFNNADDTYYEMVRIRNRDKNREKLGINKRPLQNNYQNTRNHLEYDQTSEHSYERVQKPLRNENAFVERSQIYPRPVLDEHPKEKIIKKKPHPYRAMSSEFKLSPDLGAYKERPLDEHRRKPFERQRPQNVKAFPVNKYDERLVEAPETQTRFLINLSNSPIEHKHYVNFKAINPKVPDGNKVQNVLMNKLSEEQEDRAGNSDQDRVNQPYSQGYSEANEGRVTISSGESGRAQYYEAVGARHRWRPNKERPERPGASALIAHARPLVKGRPMLAPKKYSTITHIAKMTMDREDVEQLFKDTGFNVGWRHYKKLMR